MVGLAGGKNCAESEGNTDGGLEFVRVKAWVEVVYNGTNSITGFDFDTFFSKLCTPRK